MKINERLNDMNECIEDAKESSKDYPYFQGFIEGFTAASAGMCVGCIIVSLVNKIMKSI